MIYNGRTNILVEPSTPDGSVVVALHGNYGAPSSFQADANLEGVFINSYILYVSADVSKIWKSGAKSDDVAYIHSLLIELRDNYPAADLANVHLFGHSGGASMCYKLAAYLDEFNFVSMSAISGCYVATQEFDYSGSVYHFHAANDKIVPIAGNQTLPSILETIASVNEIYKNSTFDIRASGALSDDDAHNLGKILTTYPDLMQSIKQHTGL